MFRTTVWEVIDRAGAGDRAAWEEFAAAYRAPVRAFLARRVPGTDAEDLCQDVFVRLLRGDVLAKADPSRGAFRSLLCTVAVRTLQDHLRRRRPAPVDAPDRPAPEEDFHQAWALHLTERALAGLRARHPRHHEALRAHLDGDAVGRDRLYKARRELKRALRREVALTTRSAEETEEELAFFAPYLGGRKKSGDAAAGAAKTGVEETT